MIVDINIVNYSRNLLVKAVTCRNFLLIKRTKKRERKENLYQHNYIKTNGLFLLKINKKEKNYI